MVRLDFHSPVHFLGCYAIAITIFIFTGWSAWCCGGIAFVLGVLWELLDQMNSLYSWHLRFLDSRGVDLIDVFVDLVGSLLAVGVLLI